MFYDGERNWGLPEHKMYLDEGKSGCIIRLLEGILPRRSGASSWNRPLQIEQQHWFAEVK